jgi:hypothetical protein
MAKTTANRVAEAMLKALARIETVDGFTAHSPRDMYCMYCMGFMLGILRGAERVFELRNFGHRLFGRQEEADNA